MAKGQTLLILANVAAIMCQYEYPKPTAGREFNQYVTNTQNWVTSADGERSCVLTAKSSPNACYLRFGLDAKYLDCSSEYLMINGDRICGELQEYYQYPFSGGSWAMRYRGHAPLEVSVDQVKCRESQYRTCDVTSRDMKVEITSPGYPNNYPPGSDCQYTILPANEATCQVSIYLREFDVEDSPQCRKDKLLIGSEPFCGRVKNYRLNRNLTDSLVMRFVSDSSVSGRGFWVSVEQIHCGNTLRYETQPARECCEREYNEPYAILTSPGFLGTGWTKSNCRYTIPASRPNVCRLRLYFRHFWVGDEDVFYGCVNGFLEIDRRRFCGCLDGYEYVSYFDGDRRKELRYANNAPGNRGFVIEVFQEECGPGWNDTEVDPNTEIEVFRTNMTSEKAVSRFLIPRDASRCLQAGWARQAQGFLASARVPSYCTGKRLSNPGTASQFQPGVDPAFIPPEGPPPPFFPPEEPALPFLPPFDLPPPPPVGFPPQIFPPNWVLLDRYGGEFASPGYPGRYPPNLRIRYVFPKIPGFCSVDVRFLDFDLEKSFKCWKDYLLVSRNSRFCGRSLRGKPVVLGFRYGGDTSLDFVTDGCFAGRGFRATYLQQPCFKPLANLALGNDTILERTPAPGNWSETPSPEEF